MRNTSRVRKETWIWYSVATLVLAVMMMLFCNGLSFISSAAEGKVTGSSVRIRKEASTSSDVLGSASSGETLTINSEVQGSDGKIWYQITKDGVTGYIRSDLMQKTEDTGGDTTLTVNPSVAVTNVNPVEGTITGGSQVRVRTDASTESGGIITYVGNGTKVTVKGQANGTDGKVWYLVIFNGSNGTVEGFVRSDYVNVSGEITPVDTTTPPEEGKPTEPDVKPEQPEQKKLYDTRLSDEGIWYLQDFTKNPGEEWDVVKLLEDYKANAAELITEKSTIKTQKIVIIILVVFLIGAVLIASLLYFKVKDVTDEAYFAAVEKETLRERNAMRAKDPRAPSARNVMQTVGSDGTRIARQQDARATGTKPGAPNQAGRPQTGTTRPVNGQGRPVQTQGQPVRQAGNAQSGTPQGKAAQPGAQVKPTAGVSNRPQKPGQADAASQRPVQAGQSKAAASAAQTRLGQTATPQRPVGQSASMPKPTVSTKANQNWKKNVNDDDDEFEFEFLNWDGEEK